MDILIIKTGGTIGSTYNGESIDVNSDDLFVLEKYKNEYDSKDNFTVISPINILSENISKEDFTLLYEELEKVDFDKYDGIIITCGSDTLSYISSFIGLLFNRKNKPIYIVATNMLLTELKANGYFNFLKAISCIKEKGNGVFVPWLSSDNKMTVFDATTISQVDNENNIIALGKPCYFDDSFVFDSNKLDENILLIEPYPLLKYEDISVENVKGVILNTYHSGTVDYKSVLRLKEKCDDKNIKMYIVGLKSDQKIYSSTKALLDNGVIPLYDISFPCAYIKSLLEI